MAYVDEADLASTAAGKGASMVGVESGGTAQWEMLADAAALAALAPSAGDRARIRGGGGDWIFDADDRSTEVAIDTYQGVLVAPAGDPTGASGAWARVHGGVLRPEWFGALDTAATNHLLIQTAIDLTRYVEARVVLPNRRIEIKHSLYAVDNLEMVGDGPSSEIENTLTTGEDPNNYKRFFMYLGIGIPAYLASNANDGKILYVTWDAGGAVTSGSYQMTLATAANAANYSAGDKVYCRSQAYYRSTGNAEIPHYGHPNIVVSANSTTGVVTFKYPLIISASATYLCNWTTEQVPGPVNGDGRFVGPVTGVRMSGFKVTNAVPEGHAFGFDMPLDCSFDLDIEAPEGLWVNGPAFCRFKARAYGVTDKALECAMNATMTQFEVRADYSESGNSMPFARIGECSNYNTITLYAAGTFNPNNVIGLIDITDGVGNNVFLRGAHVPQHTGCVVRFASTVRTGGSDAGSTNEPFADNCVYIECDVTTGANTRHVFYQDNASTIARCGVVGGRFHGVPSTSAITIAGTDCFVRGAWFEGGTISASGATTANIDVAGGATLASGSYAGCKSLRINGVPQHAAGAAVAHTSGNLSLDMSKTVQTIAVSGASINFTGPSNSQVGSTAKVTVVNSSGGVWTPTFGANYDLNGWTPVSIASSGGDNQSITFIAKRVPSATAAGVPTTKVMILNPTAPA